VTFVSVSVMYILKQIAFLGPWAVMAGVSSKTWRFSQGLCATIQKQGMLYLGQNLVSSPGHTADFFLTVRFCLSLCQMGISQIFFLFFPLFLSLSVILYQGANHPHGRSGMLFYLDIPSSKSTESSRWRSVDLNSMDVDHLCSLQWHKCYLQSSFQQNLFHLRV
jgi:hypothetical protein